MASSRARCQRVAPPGLLLPPGEASNSTSRFSWASSSAASHWASKALGSARMLAGAECGVFFIAGPPQDEKRPPWGAATTRSGECGGNSASMQHPAAQRFARRAVADRLEHNRRHGAVEGLARVGQAVKGAVHGPAGGAKPAPAGVLERFARLEQRLDH